MSELPSTSNFQQIESDTDLFGNSEEDEDIPSDIEQQSEFSDSDSIDETFIEEEGRNEMTIDHDVVLLSKDKKIQYTRNALPYCRLPASHTAGINCGPTLYAYSNCTDPLSSFLLCIEPIETIIVQMTNLYGRRKYQNIWNDVDITTMRAYYGLLLLAGVYRSHNECTAELWDDYTGRAIFRATMPLRKFQTITEYLRFNDKKDRAETRIRDKLAPIRAIFDTLVHKFKFLYVAGKLLTVDEQLMPYRGRCLFTQYIPSKPVKHGIKIWIVCYSETHYAYNLEIYVGRDRNCAAEVNKGERVVLQLTDGLDGRNVMCDNFFHIFKS